MTVADLTMQIPLNPTWTNITAAAGLTGGSSYHGSLAPSDMSIAVYQAVTDDLSEPSGEIVGHTWAQHPTVSSDAARGRQLIAKEGTTLWMRTDEGVATLVVTAV